MSDTGNNAENNGATPPPPPPPEAGAPAATKPAWYENVAVVIIALFCCSPLGLIFVWMNKTWTNKTKTIITAVIVGLAVVGAIISALSGGSSSSNASAPTTTAAPSTTSTTLSPEALRAAVARGTEYACAEGAKSGTGSYTRSYKNEWSSVITAADFYASVDSCVQGRKAESAQRQEEEFANAGGVDIDAMVKNPDSFKGQLFKFVVEITQYDAATGKCAFRGYWDNYQHRYNFEYAGDNALFTSGDGVSNCPVLDPVDAKDIVRVWARSTGAFSYSTQIGGKTTVPSFDVEKVEIIQKK